AAAGGKARWMGGARSLGREVCQGIRSVLVDGVSPTVTLSRRALAALQALTDEIPVSSGTHYVMSGSHGTPAQTWTFAGTRANRSLARQASTGGAKTRFDALTVHAPLAALGSTQRDGIELSDDELSAFHTSIKFAACLPRHLLSRTIVARNFEVTNEQRTAALAG